MQVNRTRALSRVICTLGALLVFNACAASPPPPAPPGWDQYYLTRDGSDVTTFVEGSGGKVVLTSPANNVNANTRVVVARSQTPASSDQTSCHTTAGHSGGAIQEGVALRVRVDGTRVRAVTVTKNVFMLATNLYNVHLWDTASDPGLPGRHLGSFATPTLGVDNPSTNPRRLCAKVIGDTLSFKVWPAAASEPAWEDIVAVHQVTLPPEARFEGRPGFYAGHLRPGASLILAQLTVGRASEPVGVSSGQS